MNWQDDEIQKRLREQQEAQLRLSEQAKRRAQVSELFRDFWNKMAHANSQLDPTIRLTSDGLQRQVTGLRGKRWTLTSSIEWFSHEPYIVSVQAHITSAAGLAIPVEWLPEAVRRRSVPRVTDATGKVIAIPIIEADIAENRLFAIGDGMRFEIDIDVLIRNLCTDQFPCLGLKPAR